MKYLLLLILSFNTYAEFKVEMSANENNDKQEFIAENQENAIKRLIKIAKHKNGWRKGDFTLVESGSLYSKVFTTCENVVDGSPIMRDIYNDLGEVIGQEEYQPLKEVCTDTTKYYHPTNWSYSITDITAGVQAKQDAIQADKDELTQIKAMVTTIENSNLPLWHKKLLKRLVRELK